MSAWEETFLAKVAEWTQTNGYLKFETVSRVNTYETEWRGDTESGFGYGSGLVIHGIANGREHRMSVDDEEIMNLWRYLIPSTEGDEYV